MRLPEVNPRAEAFFAGAHLEIAEEGPLVFGIAVATYSVDPLSDVCEGQGFAPQLVSEPLVEGADPAFEGEDGRQEGRDRFGGVEAPLDVARLSSSTLAYRKAGRFQLSRYPGRA